MLESWDNSFPEFKPIAHELKTGFPQRWVRFHSLPKSKRYPENESEYETLLQRHNAVLGSLTRPADPVVLLTTKFSETNNTSIPPTETPDSIWWRSVLIEESFWHIFAKQIIWYPRTFDPIIRQTAGDEISNLMICDTTCRWLLHPYDGGMDVFLSCEADRDLLKSKFDGWLSSRADGL
jgi:hypothetical protein